MAVLVLLILVLTAVLISAGLLIWNHLETAVALGQLVTAIAALYLGARAVWGERARLQVLRPTEVYRQQTTSHDVAALRVTVFNPSSRGNVVTLVEAYRGSRPPEPLVPLATEEELMQVRDPDGQETIHAALATVAMLDSQRVVLPQPFSSTILPVGLAPYETKVFELLVGTSVARDPKNGTGLTVRVYDARRRRSSGRTFAYTYRVHWWSKLIPPSWLQWWANREDRFSD